MCFRAKTAEDVRVSAFVTTFLSSHTLIHIKNPWCTCTEFTNLKFKNGGGALRIEFTMYSCKDIIVYKITIGRSNLFSRIEVTK